MLVLNPPLSYAFSYIQQFIQYHINLFSPQIQGLVTQNNTKIQVVDPKEIGPDLAGAGNSNTNTNNNNSNGAHLFRFQTHIPRPQISPSSSSPSLTLSALHTQLMTWLPELPIEREGENAVVVRTLKVRLSETTLDASWEWADESLAMYVLCVVRKILLDFVNNSINTDGNESDNTTNGKSESDNNTTSMDTEATNGEQLMCYE